MMLCWLAGWLAVVNMEGEEPDQARVSDAWCCSAVLAFLGAGRLLLLCCRLAGSDQTEGEKTDKPW